jgi:hypothetical protein
MAEAKKNIAAEIAKEAALLDPVDQQILLTRLRVKRLKRKGVASVINPAKGVKKPTLQQIDKWKHEVRKLS